MKLNINFMIKDGKRIISRDTKGYKVLLNRIVKEFATCKLQGVIDFNLIIQMSKKGAVNNSGLNYRYKGQCFYSKNTIHIWYHNHEDLNDILETIAHEFGHVRHYYTRNSEFMKMNSRQREYFADRYSEKIVKREIKPSISHKVRSIAAMNRSR